MYVCTSLFGFEKVTIKIEIATSGGNKIVYNVYHKS